jgi:hypothetical protein
MPASPLTEHEPHPRFFPYATTFSVDNRTVHFRYLMALEADATCVTYLAVLPDEKPQITGQKVVVKFVSGYGEQVHKFLATNRHAPALRYYGPMDPSQLSVEPAARARPGLALKGMRMVAMDYVETRERAPGSAREQVHSVLFKLHSNGYVFGDLREPNVLFDTKGVKFIDFNWCGSYDANICDHGLPVGVQEEINKGKDGFQGEPPYAWYPLTLSEAIAWPDGMAALKPIRPIHDWTMLDRLDFK